MAGMPDTASLALTPRLALALSGGGFRASLFHLGVIRRIAEEGWLGRVDVLSMVSGGSLLGAFAVPRWRRMLDVAATNGDVAALEATITKPFVAAIGARSFLGWWGQHLLTLPLRKLGDAYCLYAVNLQTFDLERNASNEHTKLIGQSSWRGMLRK